MANSSNFGRYPPQLPERSGIPQSIHWHIEGFRVTTRLYACHRHALKVDSLCRNALCGFYRLALPSAFVIAACIHVSHGPTWAQ